MMTGTIHCKSYGMKGPYVVAKTRCLKGRARVLSRCPRGPFLIEIKGPKPTKADADEINKERIKALIS